MLTNTSALHDSLNTAVDSIHDGNLHGWFLVPTMPTCPVHLLTHSSQCQEGRKHSDQSGRRVSVTGREKGIFVYQTLTALPELFKSQQASGCCLQVEFSQDCSHSVMEWPFCYLLCSLLRGYSSFNVI